MIERRCADPLFCGSLTRQLFLATLTAAAEVSSCAISALHINNINVGTANAGTGFICGDIFSHINDDTYDATISQTGPPFMVTHLSETTADDSLAGFKLNYHQSGKC